MPSALYRPGQLVYTVAEDGIHEGKISEAISNLSPGDNEAFTYRIHQTRRSQGTTYKESEVYGTEEEAKDAVDANATKAKRNIFRYNQN